MNSKRLFYVLVAILVIVNGSGVAAVILGNKYLDKQNAKLTKLKVEADTLDVVQRSLVRAKKDIDNYSDLAKVVATVVPQEKDQARTVREIVKIADESGISIASINFPTSTLGSKTTTQGAAGTSQTSQTGTITQTQKVEGINNVERLEITVTSDSRKPVTYTSFLSFLRALEKNRRTAQVGNITINPDSDNPNLVRFSLVLNVYIKKAGS